MFARTCCGDLLRNSNEPILDNKVRTKKAFLHGSDPMVSAQVMTGLSWQPFYGPELTCRPFRLEGIRPSYDVAVATHGVEHPYCTCDRGQFGRHHELTVGDIHHDGISPKSATSARSDGNRS